MPSRSKQNATDKPETVRLVLRFTGKAGGTSYSWREAGRLRRLARGETVSVDVQVPKDKRRAQRPTQAHWGALLRSGDAELVEAEVE